MLKRPCLILPLLLLMSGSLQSQEKSCTEKDTISSCLLKINNFEEEKKKEIVNEGDRVEENAAKILNNAEPMVARKLPSFDSVNSSLGTDAKSLLDLFAVAVEDAQVDEKTEAVTLTWNSKLWGLPDENNVKHHKLQVQTVIHKPEVFKPLQDAIPEAERAARVALLEDGLEGLDDVTLSATYTHVGKKYGREIDPHLPWLEDAMIALLNGVDMTAANKAMNDLGIWIQDVLEVEDEDGASVVDPQKTTLEKIVEKVAKGELPPPQALNLKDPTDKEEVSKALFDWLQKVRDEEKRLDDKVRSILSKDEIEHFDDLLSNQPEVTGSLDYRVRSKFAGPDSISLTFTHKWGFSNLNWLRKKLEEGCLETAWTQTCQKQYDDLLGIRKKSIERPWNVILDLEYKHEKGSDLTIPALEEGEMNMEMMNEPLRKMEAIPFTLSKTDQLMVSLVLLHLPWVNEPPSYSRLSLPHFG